MRVRPRGCARGEAGSVAGSGAPRVRPGLTLTFTWLRPLSGGSRQPQRGPCHACTHMYTYGGPPARLVSGPLRVPRWGSQALFPWHRAGSALPLAVLSLEKGTCGSDCSVLGSPRACVRAYVRACVRACVCRGGLAPAQGRCSQERQLGSRKQPWFPFSFLWLSEGPGWVMSLP